MKKLYAYLLAIRPKTLSAGIIPVIAACILVWFTTRGFGLELALWTGLSAVFIQIATNLFNDVIDAQKEADTQKRQGPKRVTASGMLSKLTVYISAGICLLLACLCALPLLWITGSYAWVILLIGIPSLYLSYGYTGGFFPLAYRGMGELFVFIFFGLVAVYGAVFIQVGPLTNYLFIYVAAFPLSLQCGLLSVSIIAINNIRDRIEDEKTGKRTLAVRLGDHRMRRLAILSVLAPYLLIITLSSALKLSFTWTWVPSLLFGLFLMWKIKTTPANKKMNKVLALASLHYAFFILTFWAVCYLARSHSPEYGLPPGIRPGSHPALSPTPTTPAAMPLTPQGIPLRVLPDGSPATSPEEGGFLFPIKEQNP